jgi:hypothetical protein
VRKYTPHLALHAARFHILLGDHAIVFVDGLASESYFMNGADADTSTSGKEIQDIFADQIDADFIGHIAARPFFSDKRVALL